MSLQTRLERAELIGRRCRPTPMRPPVRAGGVVRALRTPGGSLGAASLRWDRHAMTTTTVTRARDAVGAGRRPGGAPRAGGGGLQRRDRRRAAARARRRLPAPRARRRPGPARARGRRGRSSSASARSTPSRPCAPRRAPRWPSSSARSRSSTAPCTSSTSPPSRSAASDLTGVLALAAGVVLLGLAAAIPWLHRGEGDGQRPPALGLPHRRRPRRAAARLLHRRARSAPRSPRRTSSASRSAPRRARTTARSPSTPATASTSRAGTARRATGRRSSSLHGGGGDRTGAVAHAKLLVRHGYGVLLYDARGRGRSEGTQNAFGWGWTKDIAGALRFLKSRPEVDAAAHRRPRALDRRRRAGPGRRAGGEPPRRRRRRSGRRVLRGLAPPAGHHRDDADLRRRVRDGQDHLGHEVRARRWRT